MIKIIALSIVLAAIIYVVVTATNGVIDITQKSIDIANTHQLATALEMYYYDHDSYPKTASGQELTKLLEDESYIKQLPTNGSRINYSASSNGQSYKLTDN